MNKNRFTDFSVGGFYFLVLNKRIVNGLYQSTVLVVRILCVWYGAHKWPQSICGGQGQFRGVHSLFQIAMLAWHVPLPTKPSHQPTFEVLTKLYTSFSLEKMKEVFKRPSVL